MASEHFRQLRLVAPFQRLYHLFMFGDSRRPFFRAFMTDEADTLQPRLKHGVDVGKRGILAEPDDRCVDFLIELVILKAITRLVAVDHLVVKSPHLGDLGVRGRLASQPAGQFLQRTQDSQHVPHVLRAEALHHGATARHQFDEPFARQILDRFAKRCT